MFLELFVFFSYFQIRAAAELALSVLPHAASLNQNEIQRGIQQCKEESDLMLEKACDAVEKAARGKYIFKAGPIKPSLHSRYKGFKNSK